MRCFSCTCCCVQVSKEFLLGLFRESPDLLHHMTTQVSPAILQGNAISQPIVC
jgi:hypothetical protein